MARRTSTVYDRFVAYEDAGDLSVFACTEGVSQEAIDDELLHRLRDLRLRRHP